MEIFNNGSIPFSEIPLLSIHEFRSEIIRRCKENERVLTIFGHLEDGDRVRLIAILGLDEESLLHLYSAQIDADEPQYESMTPELSQAHWFEREIAEQWAIKPLGHPWLKPLRYHSNYRGVSDLWPDVDKKVIPGKYEFYSMEGQDIHELGVGPVHAGIIEPGHFRFQCHGENILHLEIQLGYQHRGIEKLMQGDKWDRSVLLSESIAGDTSLGHSIAYCEVMESLAGQIVPPRAQAIRAIGLELERLANHIGDLGALSLDAGFQPASSFLGRMRGDYLNLLLSLSGNRFGKGLCRPGGVLFDIDNAMAEDFLRKLMKYKKEFEDVSELLFSRPSVLARFEGVGAISADEARQLNLVGPVSRACQLERDVRIDYPSGMWQYFHIPISLGATGDVYARAFVRQQEVRRSLEFLQKVLSSLPKGDCVLSLGQLSPHTMAISIVEGWRGEIVHVGITDERGTFSRYKIKDPSFNNWFGLSLAVRNQLVADFPLCNKSFNLSYCGHDL